MRTNVVSEMKASGSGVSDPSVASSAGVSSRSAGQTGREIQSFVPARGRAGNGGFISRLQISDSGFAFDPQTGSTFSLNHIGVKIIRSLVEAKEAKEIAAALTAEYDLDLTQAMRDVEDFIAMLKGLELQ